MSAAKFLKSATGRKIAYHKTEGKGPGVVFLGGLKSDMEGTKAVYLEEWAQEQGRAFLRFDYSGHGQSSEKFVDGSIGEWADDAENAITELTEGKQILVGSSMGGWIALLMAKRIRARIAGLVGIATAPDFTEDSMWADMDDIMRAKLAQEGQVFLPSDYDEPYVITKKLIEEGRDQLVLRSMLSLPFPTRFLHGTDDTDVKIDVALRLLEHVSGDDIRLNLVKGADHRFSDDRCLRLIRKAIHSVEMS